MVTLLSSVAAYVQELSVAHADRLFKANDPRTTSLEKFEYRADAFHIQQEIGRVITWGSIIHVRPRD
jgi:hypothetical protein